MRLPVHQVRKSQLRPAELCIQPHAAVRQRHLRGQARLQPAEIMGPFPIEAAGRRALLLHGLDDVAHPRPPAPESLGPRGPTVALGRADDWGARGPPPGHLMGLPRDAFVDTVRPRGWGPHTRQAKMRITAERTERFRQGVIFGACRAKAAASDHPHGIDCEPQMDACIPAQPVTPADIRPARQPPRAPALGIARGDAGAVPRFIRTLLGRQQLHQMQQARAQRLMLLASLAVALLPRRQPGEGGAPMPWGIAIKSACTAKAWPRAEDCQGVTTALRVRAACGPGGGSRGQEVVQKSSVMTERVVRKGFTSTTEYAPSLGEERAILPARGTFHPTDTC